MPTEPYFDLESARKTLRWLIPKLTKMKELSIKGDRAMDDYDLDAADYCTKEIHKILDGVRRRGIVVRDQDATLFDFPAVIDNIPAYLCWSIDEDDIEFWHYADQGFTGRNRLTGEENILGYL